MTTSYQQLVLLVNSEGVLNVRVEPNIEILNEAGFLVLNKYKFLLSEDQAEILAPNQSQRKLFTDGPVCVLLLKREEAFQTLRQIKDELDDFYYSVNSYTALRDQVLFFPQTPTLERTVVFIKPRSSQDDF